MKQKKQTNILIIVVALLVMSCTPKYPLDLGDGYVLNYGPNGYLSISDSTGTGMISRYVMQYGVDSTFIIVKQKPYDLICKMYRKTTNKPKLPDRRRYFEEIDLHYYWIINKKEECVSYYDPIRKKAIHSNVYGPYTKEEFVNKRKELQVSDTLSLCIKTPYTPGLWMNHDWWEKKPVLK